MDERVHRLTENLEVCHNEFCCKWSAVKISDHLGKC